MSFDVLSEENFALYAAKNYDSPGCITVEEFFEDMSRFKYLKKLFKRYKLTGDLKERLILNHIIILNNIFGAEAATRMMFYKLDGYYDCLKPFLLITNTLPVHVKGIGEFVVIRTEEIMMDQGVIEKLRSI